MIANPTTDKRLTGAQFIIRLLRHHGVDTVFGLSGNGMLGLFDAALDHELRIIDMRHESAVVEAAGGRALASRQTQVCFVTEGPGLSNALGGIAAMNHDGIPVIVITNCESDELFGTGTFQEMDQVAMAKPISKWSAKIHDAAHLSDWIARAFRQARAGVPGSVVLTVPNHILLADCAAEGVELRTPTFSRATTECVPSAFFAELVLAKLRSAQKPLLLVGSGAYWDRADAALLQFVRRTGIPVGTCDLARGLIDDKEDLCLGDGRPFMLPPSLMQADVVFVLGERIDYMFDFGRRWSTDTAFIQVYSDPVEIGRSVDVEVSSTANTRLVLEAMTAALGDEAWPIGPWARQAVNESRQHRIEALGDLSDNPSGGIHPAAVALEVEELAGPEATIVIDGANCANWARLALRARRSDHYLEWGRLGMIGMGLPYALGAKTVRPLSPVILIVGDGSLGFHFMELETAIRHNLPVIVVVCNDSGWGIERHFQRGIFGRETCTSLSTVAYDEMATCLGGLGLSVATRADLRDALVEALECGRPALINAHTQDVADPLTKRVTKVLARKYLNRPQPPTTAGRTEQSN